MSNVRDALRRCRLSFLLLRHAMAPRPSTQRPSPAPTAIVRISCRPLRLTTRWRWTPFSKFFRTSTINRPRSRRARAISDAASPPCARATARSASTGSERLFTPRQRLVRERGSAQHDEAAEIRPQRIDDLADRAILPTSWPCVHDATWSAGRRPRSMPARRRDAPPDRRLSSRSAIASRNARRADIDNALAHADVDAARIEPDVERRADVARLDSRVPGRRRAGDRPRLRNRPCPSAAVRDARPLRRRPRWRFPAPAGRPCRRRAARDAARPSAVPVVGLDAQHEVAAKDERQAGRSGECCQPTPRDGGGALRSRQPRRRSPARPCADGRTRPHSCRWARFGGAQRLGWCGRSPPSRADGRGSPPARPRSGRAVRRSPAARRARSASRWRLPECRCWPESVPCPCF